MLMFAMHCSSPRSHQLHPHLHILIASSSPPFDHHHLPHQCPSIASVAFPISCFLTSSPSIDSHSSIIPSPLPCHLHNIFIQTTSLFASRSPSLLTTSNLFFDSKSCHHRRRCLHCAIAAPSISILIPSPCASADVSKTTRRPQQMCPLHNLDPHNAELNLRGESSGEVH